MSVDTASTSFFDRPDYIYLTTELGFTPSEAFSVLERGGDPTGLGEITIDGGSTFTVKDGETTEIENPDIIRALESEEELLTDPGYIQAQQETFDFLREGSFDNTVDKDQFEAFQNITFSAETGAIQGTTTDIIAVFGVPEGYESDRFAIQAQAIKDEQEELALKRQWRDIIKENPNEPDRVIYGFRAFGKERSGTVLVGNTIMDFSLQGPDGKQGLLFSQSQIDAWVVEEQAKQKQFRDNRQALELSSNEDGNTVIDLNRETFSIGGHSESGTQIERLETSLRRVSLADGQEAVDEGFLETFGGGETLKLKNVVGDQNEINKILIPTRFVNDSGGIDIIGITRPMAEDLLESGGTGDIFGTERTLEEGGLLGLSETFGFEFTPEPIPTEPTPTPTPTEDPLDPFLIEEPEAEKTLLTTFVDDGTVKSVQLTEEQAQSVIDSGGFLEGFGDVTGGTDRIEDFFGISPGEIGEIGEIGFDVPEDEGSFGLPPGEDIPELFEGETIEPIPIPTVDDPFQLPEDTQEPTPTPEEIFPTLELIPEEPGDDGIFFPEPEPTSPDPTFQQPSPEPDPFQLPDNTIPEFPTPTPSPDPDPTVRIFETPKQTRIEKTKQKTASRRGRTIAARDGFEGFVNKPTMFLAGEAGREHVKITPIKMPKGNPFDMDLKLDFNMFNGIDNQKKVLNKTKNMSFNFGFGGRKQRGGKGKRRRKDDFETITGGLF